MELRCPLCDGDVFTEYDCEMVCVVCHVSMGHVSADGGSRINFGSEQNDMSCTTVSGLLPDLSGNLKIEGFGNSCVKRMYKWKYVQYLEKMIIQFYTKTMNNITMYEFKSSFDRLGIPYEKGWSLEEFLEHAKKNKIKYDKDWTLSEFQAAYDKLKISYEKGWTINNFKDYAELNGIPQPPINKKMVEKTINIYKSLYMSDAGKKNFCHREKNKIGIISVIYYYVNKEYDIIFEKNLLCDMFNIDKEVITYGNNLVNKVLKKNPGLRKYINKTPLTLEDYVKKIDVKFPQITEDEVRLIKSYINKIKGTVAYYKNSPKTLLVGILTLISKNYTFSLSEEDIRNGYDLSQSTLNKYEKKLKVFY